MVFSLENQIATVILLSLTLYTLFAGADFGGGVWDLFAWGSRSKAQRSLISKAIAPIWETNHIWLILVIVLLFSCFPKVFSTISIALHIPITLMLIGIVLRGSAFAFRSYGPPNNRFQTRWGLVFSVSSIFTPITLGMCIGAIVSGTIKLDKKTGMVQTDYFSSWLAPFPIALGFLTLALFAFLAAVYLILETKDKELQEDFRKRALFAGLIVGVMAWLCFALAGKGAPMIAKGLQSSSWSLPFHIVTGMIAFGTFLSLFLRYYWTTRVFASLQVILIIGGWGLAQYPYLIYPDLTIQKAAASEDVLRPIMLVLLLGITVLVPALWYLFKIFKDEQFQSDSSKP